MTTEYEREQKETHDLVLGDLIKIGDLTCIILKLEDVFHNIPAAYTRLTLGLVGTKTKKKNIILFLPHGTMIEILK